MVEPTTIVFCAVLLVGIGVGIAIWYKSGGSPQRPLPVTRVSKGGKDKSDSNNPSSLVTYDEIKKTTNNENLRKREVKRADPPNKENVECEDNQKNEVSLKDSQRKTICVSCEQKNVSVIAVPCGHAYLCHGCAEKIRGILTEIWCITCQKPVEHFDVIGAKNV